MHFFYLDESGDTGRDLNNADQPIMVLGGVNLRDEGWNKTQSEFAGLIDDYFSGNVPDDFELHASDLLCPDGEGPFAGHSMADRSKLAMDVIDLVAERKHGVHLVAFDKSKVRTIQCGLSLAFDPSLPYLLAFDYMITYINWYVKEKLGQSARGLIILDEKRQFHPQIEKITRNRRFEGPAAHRVKWIVEISYPVDSKKNPMVQISDLIVFCTRRFLEIDHGHRPGWGQTAVDYYAKAYCKIHDRIVKKQTVPRGGRNMDCLNRYIDAVRCDLRGQWKKRYGV